MRRRPDNIVGRVSEPYRGSLRHAYRKSVMPAGSIHPSPDSPLTNPTPTKSHPNRYKVVNNSPNKGGRPSTKKILEQFKDESKAFDSIRDKWTLISHKLADEALKAARDPKKILDGKSLVSLTTSAGIAYDKRWSKATADTTEIAMPPALISAIASKCASPSPNSLMNNESQLMVQGKPFTEQGQEAAEVTSEEGSPEPAAEPASQDG